MSVSYAGVNLPLATPELQEWLDRFHPISGVVEEVVQGYAQGSTNLWYLALPPEPEPTPCRLGVLTWPTGASRAATFYFCCNSTKLDEIREAVGNTPLQDLVLSDGTRSITASMYLLRPRPLFQIDGTEQLYLCCLADERVKWRWRTGNVGVQPSSWTALFAAIGNLLGTTITTDGIAAAYQTPSLRWRQYQQPLGPLLDCVAAAVGHRVVVALDGTVTTAAWDTAYTAQRDQYDDFVAAHGRLAGGRIDSDDIARTVPESVAVVFGQTRGGVARTDPHVVTKTLAGLAVPGYGAATGWDGATAQVHSDYVHTGTAASVTTADAVAGQAAYDFFGWAKCDSDFTAPGIWDWEPTGGEDRVEWTYTADGRLLTRVWQGPWQVLPVGGWEPAEGDCGGVGDCAWVAGLSSYDCLTLSVTGAYGRCGTVDTDQTLSLNYDAGVWVGDDQLDYVGGSGDVEFGLSNGVPFLTVGGVYGTPLPCDCDGCLRFSFGGDTLCPEGDSDAEDCANYFTVAVCCGCCLPLWWWGGAGWYCVYDEGLGYCDVVELIDDDRCDDAIVYCSGPYESEEDAEDACDPSTGAVVCDVELPNVVWAEFSDCTGSASFLDGLVIALPYDPSIVTIHAWRRACVTAPALSLDHQTLLFYYDFSASTWRFTFNASAGECSTGAANSTFYGSVGAVVVDCDAFPDPLVVELNFTGNDWSATPGAGTVTITEEQP